MLKGKVALVTGGTSDVGRNICQVFAREGASVVIADKEENEPHIIAQALKPGDSSQSFRYIAINKDDMKTLKSVKDCIIHGIFINKDRQLTQNVCINCAGVISQSSILSSDETVYEQFLDLQLKSTVSITRTVCDFWASKKMSGSVVNVSCIPYILKGSKNWSTYVANIEAIKGFSKSVNKEYGRSAWHKIRCNTVCDKQYGRSEGTAEIVAYLASDYSSYVTASHVSIDGKIMYGNH